MAYALFFAFTQPFNCVIIRSIDCQVKSANTFYGEYLPTRRSCAVCVIALSESVWILLPLLSVSHILGPHRVQATGWA